jgi:prephenate dehydratase
LKVGYQGVLGAYSEEALITNFPETEPVSCRTLVDGFAALSAGEVEAIFIPVENSHAGTVVEAYDLMLEQPVTVRAERIHLIRHCLLGLPGAELRAIERVYSHPQALSQAAAFLRQHNLPAEPFYDTAGAAQMVAERGDRRYAAVASHLAGERYGLSILAEDIQTASDNATRFFLLEPGSWTPDRTVFDGTTGKTALVFSTEHKPGALVRALSCFSREQVNLARLESRPSRQKPWEYLFFTDVEGYAHEPRLNRALRELKRLNPYVQVLGSVPAAHQVVEEPVP